MDAFVLVYRHSPLTVKYRLCRTEHLTYMASYAITGYIINLATFFEGGCLCGWNSICQIQKQWRCDRRGAHNHKFSSCQALTRLLHKKYPLCWVKIYRCAWSAHPPYLIIVSPQRNPHLIQHLISILIDFLPFLVLIQALYPFFDFGHVLMPSS